jgi:hypothetical protein
VQCKGNDAHKNLVGTPKKLGFFESTQKFPKVLEVTKYRPLIPNMSLISSICVVAAVKFYATLTNWEQAAERLPWAANANTNPTLTVALTSHTTHLKLSQHEPA